jgi:serine/threonine-protein kinase
MNVDSLSPGTVPITPGEVLDGKYRVDQVLGVGGMGIVVAATHLQLGTRVALKFMLAEGLKLPGLVERFSREARAAVRLKSDHVARVLDVGTLSSGSPYMVMEYLEGSDLGSIVESRGPMPVDVAVDCVLQACDAVAEAHSLGIVHRDLKPRNLFLTQRNDGRALVKVLDFGISKDRTGADLGLTRTTEVIGSPNYMSPEQLRSTRAADERSDIWALGVILYELLTGRVPFVAESITQLTAMVLTEPPRPIAQLRPDLPRDLARAVERCLEKEPEKRFVSVAQLAAALEKFAPADTQQLASRIARIASGVRPSQEPSHSSSARIAVAGSTSVSWAGKTELASSRGKAIAFVSVAALVLGAGAVVGGVALLRSRRPAPAAVVEAPTATAHSVTGGPTAAPEPAATLAPLAAASTPLPASAPTEAHAAPSASAMPHSPQGNPRGPAVPKGPEPAPSGSTYETPKYRTSW